MGKKVISPNVERCIKSVMVCEQLSLKMFPCILIVRVVYILLFNHIIAYLCSETYSRKSEKRLSIVIHECKIYFRNNLFVANVWPAISSLIIDDSTNCVESALQQFVNTVDLVVQRYASALGARGPVL